MSEQESLFGEAETPAPAPAPPPAPPGTPPPADPPLPEIEPQLPGAETTVAQAREWMREKLHNGGATCPVCDRPGRIYRRKLNSGMARALILMYKAGAVGTWVHGGTVVGRSARDESLLRYWGLTEEELEIRPDGGRSGYWRVTNRGAAFAEGTITVPSHVLVYNGKFLGHDDDVTQITIHDALGDKFRYDELMAETAA